MKRILFLFSALLISPIVFAQAPDAFKYQAVVRDNSGNLITDQAVGIQIEILKGSTGGTSVYVETHSVTSNDYGLVNLEIGSGTTTDDLGNINWGEDDYFLQVSLDATGGTSYELMGTSQLLSVPYALHSSVADSVVKESQTLAIDGNTLSISSGNSVDLPVGGTSNSGKSYVLITGDISDADAATKIMEEVGDNTDYIMVGNTTQLTTLDLSGITEIIEIEFTNNGSLETINIDDLENIKTFRFVNNSALSSITLPAAKTIGRLEILQAEKLLTIESNNLEFGSIIHIGKCPLLNNIGLNNLESVGTLILEESGLSSFALPKIRFVTAMSLLSCSSLSSCDFPILESGEINITSCGLTSVSFPNLVSSTNFVLKGCSSLTSIDVPNLESGDFYIESCGVTSITLPKFATCTEIGMVKCLSLTSIEVPILTTFNTAGFIDNALTSETVNSLLAYFVSISPSITGKSIYLFNQNPTLPPTGQPLAPPTGQGIIDKATLIANGNNVITD